MTGRRYLAFVASDESALATWRPRLADAAALSDGFRIRIDQNSFILLSQRAPIRVEPGGAILGDLVRDRTTELVGSLSAAEGATILATRGQSLIDDFWGGYVAFLPRRYNGVDVIRAPMGDLACYRLEVEGGTVVASDMGLLIEWAGYRPTIDWTTLGDSLLAPELRWARTCLEGVSEITGGERLTIGHPATITRLWSPWSFVTRRPSIHDENRSQDQLRRVICASIAARASAHDQSILLLSGGLDSSIVAAALARWRCRADGLTMVTRDLAGDERGYARLTAEHLGLRLHEVVRDIEEVDITRSAAAGLPYPAERSFSQATLAAAQRLATTAGASAVIHGGGGDHVFGSIQSAAPVTDLLRRRRVRRPLWQTANSIASIAQVTTAAVFRQAIARLFRRGPIARIRPITDLLSDEIKHRGSEAVRHPWLETPRRALPGSAAHVVNITYALSIVQSPDARAPLPSIAVLLAQPIVEACLAIPSWCWFDNGYNRAYARQAFSEMLPDAVIWRRSKGALNGFMVEILEANRATLRSFLLDGALASSGLVDRPMLEAALSRRGPVKGDWYGRILEFADVEAWLRSWSR